MSEVKMKMMDGNEAAASVAHRMNEVCVIYPITPSSPMAENIDQWSAKGKKNIFGKTVEVTVRTDKETLGDALSAVSLIQGDKGPYGLYVKKVNGITADYDVDKSYWAFYINGEYAMSGVDTTNIDETAKYQLAYPKE